MIGLQVFTTVAEALRAGYSVYDRYEHGYWVRIRLSSGRWALAIVDLR
jgi:hypothetical protein